MKIKPSIDGTTYKKLKVELKGARFPINNKFSEVEIKEVAKPYDNKIGLILFEGTNNFFTLGTSGIDHNDAIFFSKDESVSIGKLEVGNRAGAAGGMVYPTTNSRSLSKVTKKRNSFLIANKKSSGLTCHYLNDNHVIKSYNGVYNDILMRKLNSYQKTKHILKHKYLQSITIQEMTKRIQTIIIAYQFGLYQDMKNNPFEVFNSIIEGKRNMNLLMTFVSLSYSRFESALLVWSCCSGESRNHTALAAHVDANTSNEIESLVLYGRIPYNSRNNRKQIINQYIHGKLYCPCYGIDISYKCVEDIVHCNLQQIIHLPDDSRNTHNWSRVHGPP